MNWTRVKDNEIVTMATGKGQVKRIRSLYLGDIFVSFFLFLFEE